MDADLMAFGDDASLLVAIEQGDDGGHVERRRHGMPCKQLQDARDADAIAILSPRHASDGFAPVAQLVGLVIGIERQREGASRATLPALRTIGAPGADLIDEAAPMRFRPLPGLHLGHVVHDRPPNLVFCMRVHASGPPVTGNVCPVIHEAWSEARNVTALAMSCGAPMRRIAIVLTKLSRKAAGQSFHCRS